MFSGMGWGAAGKKSSSYSGIRLPANRDFERELAGLEAMDGLPPAAAGIDRVRTALPSGNSLLVSKAARISVEHTLTSMLPEIRAAYEYFFVDAVQQDPQCVAKIALAKALVKLGCRETALYLRGLRHVQQLVPIGGRCVARDDPQPVRLERTIERVRIGIERGKQTGGAMTDIVMSAAFDLPWAHGQQRCRSIQSLYLRLLVHA